MKHPCTFVCLGLTIRISPAIFILLPICLLLGLAGSFCILFTAVTAHELAHILTARHFGLRATRLDITPLGEMAVLDGIETLSLPRRLWILLAGPLVSMALAGLCCALPLPLPLAAFARANLTIGLFNLLPVCPLDGGRIVCLLTERAAGIVTAHRFSRRLSAIGSVLVMALGVVQVILFPPNISLLSIGIYLYTTGRATASTQAVTHYRDMVLRDSKAAFRRPLPCRVFRVPNDTPVKAAYARLNWDCRHEYRLHPSELLVTEASLLHFIRENGLRGTLMDCAASEDVL